ncbi:MAG: GNAT family N-acetyltransferase [Chloroflexi bacterium]|nr:GNAT family N-acetyltransferase [Chloroflexota bacterium]
MSDAGGYVVSDRPDHLDVPLIARWLRDESYWAAGVSEDVVRRAIANSLCFGAYRDGAQVGFLRVVTDRATFAWLCDVFVIAEHRGNGVSKLMMDAVMAHPDLQALRSFLLATRDAHGLYARYGFEVIEGQQRYMRILRPYRANP